jgi:hypothetical protein
MLNVIEEWVRQNVTKRDTETSVGTVQRWVPWKGPRYLDTIRITESPKPTEGALLDSCKRSNLVETFRRNVSTTAN